MYVPRQYLSVSMYRVSENEGLQMTGFDTVRTGMLGVMSYIDNCYVFQHPLSTPTPKFLQILVLLFYLKIVLCMDQGLNIQHIMFLVGKT